MKKLLVTILCFCAIPVCAGQNDDDLSKKIKSGSLSYEECVPLLNTESLPDVIPSLLNLKQQYEQADRYDGATYFGIVLALNNYYIAVGDFASSRKLIEEAGNTFSKREAEPNNEYVRSLLCCRGQLEVMLTNYKDALKYLLLAQKYFEEKNDRSDPYIVTMMNISLAYQNLDDLPSAQTYMDEGIAQFEKAHGSVYEIRDEAQLIVLNNYAFLNVATGRYALAEKCFKAVINRSRNTPASQEAYILASNNLAWMYMRQGRWSEAANLLKDLSGNSERNYLVAQNKAVCYMFLKDYPSAVAAVQEMNRYSLTNTANLFSHFTGIERENYWSEISGELIYINNLIAYHSCDNRAVSVAYDNTLFCKNLLVNSSRLIDRFVESSNDAGLKKKFADYNDLKSQLAYKSKTEMSRDSLASKIVDTERSILDSAGNFGQWLRDEAKKWKDVQAALGKDEIAIEFCYAPRMYKYPDVQPYYGAFIIRRDFDSPKLVSLEKVDVVEGVLDCENRDEVFVNELYSQDKSSALYTMLWDKLRPYLNGIKTVYYSPAGALSNVNFDVLQSKDGKMLNDEYNMRRVSSTASVADVKAYGQAFHDAVLYGNVKYDEAATGMADASAAYGSFTGTAINHELALRSENDRSKWGAIPSTKTEIDSIGAMLSRKGVKVSAFEGSSANEESFKALSGNSPEIIHLATHGFVIDTPKRAEGNKFVASTSVYSPKDSYMMWTGLMLAGGNNIWQGNFNLKNVEDGILTADEISRLDLGNTKLVVLSACETARGKIDPVDGVYGLQRAFKMAGAGTVVMSLWKVQDDATSMLMTRFYKYLTDGVEKHKALWKAMMDVREKYKDPYYWAGFVMLD